MLGRFDASSRGSDLGDSVATSPTAAGRSHRTGRRPVPRRRMEPAPLSSSLRWRRRDRRRRRTAAAREPGFPRRGRAAEARPRSLARGRAARRLPRARGAGVRRVAALRRGRLFFRRLRVRRRRARVRGLPADARGPGDVPRGARRAYVRGARRAARHVARPAPHPAAAADGAGDAAPPSTVRRRRRPTSPSPARPRRRHAAGRPRFGRWYDDRNAPERSPSLNTTRTTPVLLFF